MLTDLTWLQTGKSFPPECERERIEKYHHNKELFECEHSEVYKRQLKRIERVIGNFEDVVSFAVPTNFQKLISLKTADLLLGKTPKITHEKSQPALDLIVKHSKLHEKTNPMAAIDISRYGDGLLFVRKQDTYGVVDITQPCNWFPIVSDDNVQSIQMHVLAWCVGEKDDYKLKVQIHHKGSYDTRVYKMLNGKIGALIEWSLAPIQTGLTDFAVIQISNVITSDRVTGYDDYTDIDGYVSEYMVRIGQIDRILDKHASPTMWGPASGLEQDPITGGYTFKAGNYVVVDSKDDPVPGYITWEGQLAANFNQLDRLIKLIYLSSEMGGAVLGDLLSAGSITSAEQLRLAHNTALAKVARIKTHFDPALKQALALASQLGGVVLKEEEISINWFNQLPVDPKVEAETMQIRTGGKATISQLSAIKIMNDTDDDGADAELAKIQDDETMASPMQAPPMANQPEGGPDIVKEILKE